MSDTPGKDGKSFKIMLPKNFYKPTFENPIIEVVNFNVQAKLPSLGALGEFIEKHPPDSNIYTIKQDSLSVDFGRNTTSVEVISTVFELGGEIITGSYKIIKK